MPISTIPKYGIDYLVVAGGGGGAGQSETPAGAGGGAGGHAMVDGFSVDVGATYTVTVGAGGTGGTSHTATDATNGANSTFAGTTALGGGYGGRFGTPAG